ncbi:MAG: hypothetical protein AAGD11_09290 [Planctomycetota bacterium]
MPSWSQAGEQTLGTVDADTYIALDANADPAPADIDNGSSTFLEVRGGDPFNLNSLTSKTLIRFDLGASPTIDPDLPYFFEVTTDDARNSNDTFRLYAINDAPTQAFEEATFTWNLADASAPNASAGLNNFTAAGPRIGTFFAPEPSQADAAVGVPILGSDISTFVSGNTFATFGITSTETNRLRFNSKENANVAPRLYTFDALDSASNGATGNASTWTGGAPTAGNLYRVNSGHTVSVAAGAFAGEGIVVQDGTLDFSSGVIADIPLIQVNANGNLSNSGGGSVEIGDGSLSRNDARFHGGLVLNRDLTYTAAAGDDLTVNLPIRSTHDFTFQGGAGSDLTMRFPQAHRGTINFNGAGDNVVLTDDEGIGGTLVMNSTGANTVVYLSQDTEQEFGSGTIRFDQPGTIDHSGSQDRLQGEAFLEVNAPLTIDMSSTFSNNERRYRVTRDIAGAGNVLFKGTPTAPSGELPNTLEFSTESGNETNNKTADNFTGTLTTEGFAIVRSRLSMPEATINVAAGAELQTGYLLAPEERVRFGEINVAGESSAGAGDSGILTVGATNNDTTNLLSEQHRDQLLVLSTTTNGSGDLNLTPDDGSTKGSITRMTIQSDPAGGLFDQIEVQGDATLGGKLQIIVNGIHPTQDGEPGELSGRYDTPTIGDTFDIIYAGGNGLTTRTADFDGINGVDSADLAIWDTNYGTPTDATNATGDADSDGDVDGSDFLAWQDELGTGIPTGTISGTFDEIEVLDAAFGVFGSYTFELDYSEVNAQFPKVKLVLTGFSPISALGTVPEPSSVVLLAIAGLLSGSRATRRYR